MLFDQECHSCHGEGRIWVSRYGGNDPDVGSKPCHTCDGAGVVEVDLNDEIDDDND